MSWTFEPVFDAAHRAALESGRSIIYVCPPAPWVVRPLFERLAPKDGTGPQVLVLVPDVLEAVEFLSEVSQLPPLAPAHASTGLARTAKRISTGTLKTLIVTAADTMQLVTRSSLRLETVEHVVVCWPEALLELGHGAVLDEILGECARAQRLIATADEKATGDLLERHARRAPVLTVSRPADVPVSSIRYAVAPSGRVAEALRAALDAYNAASALVWDPTSHRPHRWTAYQGDPTLRVSADLDSALVDLAIAVELPTAESLAALRAIANDVVVLVRPRQVRYLTSLADRPRILRLRSEADTAQDWRVALRNRVRDRLDDRAVYGNLLALAPLFDEFDPAMVAAAILDLPEPTPAAPTGSPQVPHWVHLHLNLGQRDRVRTGDVVGALLNAAGLSRDQIGRVDMREKFTVVEVRAEAAEAARRGMDGVVLRGRSVSARFDRM